MNNQTSLASRQLRRPYDYQVSSEMAGRMSPVPSSVKAKVSHSPGHWKKYLASDIDIRGQRSNFENSQTNFQSAQNLSSRPSYNQAKVGFQSGHETKFEQQKRRKQDMMKRVQQIQKKVLPILKAQRNNEEEDDHFGWYNRMEQRISKMETNIDSIQKQMQIKIEKRILQVQKQWSMRIQSLLQTQSQHIEQKKLNRIQSAARLSNQRGFMNQDVVQQDKDSQKQLEEGQKYKARIGHESNEGYFTKRENEVEKQKQIQFGGTDRVRVKKQESKQSREPQSK